MDTSARYNPMAGSQMPRMRQKIVDVRLMEPLALEKDR